ncbi:MAG: YbaN family protein [Longimicrobiales bacterium]
MHRDPESGPTPEARGGRVPRWPFAVLAYLFTGLALVGVVVPGLPTFPFLLLAAWAAARGSKRLHDWLYDHPRFGAALIEWEQERAVSRRSKTLAVALMALSWLIMVWRVDNIWVPVGLAALFLVVGTYVVTRPEPSASGHPTRHQKEA